MTADSRSYPTTRVPATPYRRPTPRSTDTLRLDGNEGDRPQQGLLEELGGLEPSMLREYPDLSELQDLIAARHGVDPACVVVTAGADDAIDRLCRAYLEPGRELLVPVPTFEMIHRFAATAGGTVATIPWTDSFPTDELIGRIGDNTAIVAIVSPNNPTGLTVSAEDLTRVAAAADCAYVLLDHAYVDYADEDLTDTALELENVVVARTFSKAWGLAGCRVGYLIASPDVANVIRNAGNPYPVSALSIAVVLRRLRRGGRELEQHTARIREERERFRAQLTDLGVQTSPSEGNFVFAELGDKAQFVYEALATLDVLVRFFPHREEISTGLRISLPGHEEDFAKLTDAVDLCLAPQALLFDMDGVLANVENSYRRSTLETVRSYGVQLERTELETAVLAGDANNDWILSQRLLSQNGIEVSFDEIYERYQSFYLGTDDSPGLRENETLLVDRAVLESLASRMPLGVVTGRPREEAEWFLDRVGIAGLFETTVCLEDGPNKPDPTPVRLALERLGVKRAWMIGDTPDDIRAATAAGTLPIGIIAPNADPETNAAALTDCGAATIIDDVAALQELIP